MFLSVYEVAERYGVSPATIWRWASQEEQFPKPMKVGRASTRWPLQALEAYEQDLEFV